MPGYGEWAPDRIAEALRQLESSKRAAGASGQAPPLEPYVVEAVTQCVDWMRRAQARPGFGVIGFRS
jgi:hypothetical protein